MKVRLVWLAFLIVVGLVIENSVATAAPPNIILCMGDDHGWDETSYNGHPHVKTPVLDEMAEQGLRFNRFYSAHPSCSPTRGSIITGRHPNRYGTFTPNCSIRPEEIGIASLLAEAGYRCGHFGKWHLGPVKAASPTNPGAFGFDEWLSHDNFFELDPILSRDGGPPTRFPGESSEVVVDDAIRFIKESQTADRPFFAVIWFGSPHEPYAGLEEDLKLYDDLPARYADRQVKLTSLETGLPVRRPLGEVLRERYAEITAMDRSLGKLRDFLAAEDLRDNTLLWYCGDNGVPSSGRLATPFRGEKGLVYEGGVRVPGIIEWPAAIPRGRISDLNAVTTDTLPTLCELVDVPLPKRPMDGVSLRPLLDGAMDTRPQPICFWSFTAKPRGTSEPYIKAALQQGTTPLVKKMAGKLTRDFRNFHHPDIDAADFIGPRAILDDRYKLVIHESKTGQPRRELFDMRAEQAESENLIEEHPAIAARLGAELRQWQQSVLESLTGADYR